MSDSIVNMEAKQDANRTAGESSGQNPLKKQIDPLELLNCLSILLNSKGAIKSIDEVQRVAGLMGKYSKKLVSKCIYLNILQATEEPLLDEFYKETGWNLVCAWLTEAMATKNYPLAQQILTLLLVSPITVERLKRNNMPKMVKDLSKDCPHAGARETAENVVQRWKDLVKVFSSEGPNAVNRELGGTDPHPESSADCVRVSVINPVPLNIVNSHVSAIVVNNKSVLDEANKSDLTTSEAESVAESTIPEAKTLDPPAVVTENPPIPKLKVGRGRGSPGRGGLRGVGRGRARRKRGTVAGGRGRGKSLISYAELLCQDIDSTYDPSDEAKEDNRDSNSSSTSGSSSNEDVSSTNPPAGASVPPLRIAIRNGVKVLPAETKGTASKAKRKRPSVDSTDSDDNKPLSIIRNERQKLAVDVIEEKFSPQDKDKSLPKDSEVKSEPTEIVKDEVKGASTDKIKDEVKVKVEVKDEVKVKVEVEDDDDEVVVKSRVKGKRRILVYKSDDDDDDEKPPVKKEPVDGEVAVKDSKEPKSENEKKKKKEEEKVKSKELEDGTDKVKSKDSDKKKDKKSSSEKSIGKTDKEREKNREKERERERSKHKGSKDKYRDRDKDKDKDREKSRDKDRDRKDDKKKDKDRRRDSDDKDRRKEQAEKDKATLDKVKPLSTEGMGKIPRKSSTSSVTSPKIVTTTPVSFLDALGSADSDLAESKKALLVKSKSRGFRNTGLLDETIKPPGVAGKRLTEVPPKRQGTSSSSSSSSSSTSDLFDHKKVLKAPSSAPPSGDRPGGIKLISPKRPTLSDDGGFMAALTAAGADRKKISRKRKSSDSESKSEGTQSKIHKTETSKESLDDSIKSEEDGVSPLKAIPEEDCTIKQEEKVEDSVLLSPTSIKPTFNFYKDTLVETTVKEEPSTPADKEEGASNSDSETGAPSEATVKEEATEEELPSSNDTKKDDDPMEIEEPDDVDTKEEPMEIAGGGDGEEDNNCIISFGGKEESMDRDGGSATNLLQEAPVPAPAQEDYEKVEVTFTPTKDLRGVLVYHRPQNRRKRNVNWRPDTELKEIFYFPMDETERVNVNTIKFNDMMMMEKAKEKEVMFCKNRNRIFTENHMGMMDSGMVNTCIDFGPYKLYPVHSSNPSNVTPGFKSMEKHVQAQREHNTMATFFHPSMLPETPTEPDPEMVQRAEPVNIPLKDVSGSDSLSDNRNIPWPEPLFDHPSGFPFVGNSAPHTAPPVPPQSGGHWVLGNHTVPRFAGGPSLYGGPPGPQGPQGPVNNPANFGPPQGFPGEMRGGWGGPSDFGGPPVLLPNGPPMGMGVGMGGPNPGMHGGPPLQSGPVMGMGGGPPPMGNRDNYHRYNRRGGSGNWGGPQGGRGFCKHFRHGNCRHGDDCKFLHVPS